MVGTIKRDRQAGGDSTINVSISSNAADRTRTQNHMLVAPWPEWSDSEINAEKWETGFRPSTVQVERLKGRSFSFIRETSFENPLERRSLPGSLQGQIYEWKRALNVNPRFQVLPENPEATDLDLVSSNGHILHSELIKHIVTSIMNLHHLAAMKPFQEASSDNFMPNGGPIWKPWNHVYSMCKVGKGTSHKPSVNKFGKYVVRVHFLGQWRRITVDDYLPLDEFGRILLPTTTRDELWPILLAKAITLIASLTCTPTSEVLEMNAVTCFTGWFALKVECQRVPAKDVWHVCQKALMHEAEDGARYKEEPKTTDAYQLGLAMAGGDRKDPLTYAMSNDMEEGWGSVAVFADMADIEEDPEEEVGEIGPCVGHQVLFSEARIIRIGDDGGVLPLWKTFRWKKWALQKGIIQQEHLVNVKSLRLFAPLKKWMPPAPRTANDIFFEMSQLEEVEEEIQEVVDDGVKGKKKKGKSKDSGKGVEKNSGSKAGKTGKKSSSQGSKKTPKIEIVIRENTDPWANFNVYSKYVTSILLFFRKSSFKHCESHSDISMLIRESETTPPPTDADKKKSATPTKKTPPSHPLPHALKSTTMYKTYRPQDYFYMITDTPTAKKIFFHVGVVSPSAVAKQNAILNNSTLEKEIPSWSSIIVCQYKKGRIQWEGPSRLHFPVVGTTTRMLELEDGIVGLAVVPDLPPNHYFQISSQTEFRVGGHGIAHEALSGPHSLSLAKYGKRIYNAFSNLQRCARGTPEHEEALVQYHTSFVPESITSFFSATRSLGRFTASLKDKCERVCTGLLFCRLQNDFEQFYTALKELQQLMMAPRYGIDVLKDISEEFHELTLLRDEGANRLTELINEEDAGGVGNEVHTDIVEKASRKGSAKKGKETKKGGSKNKKEKPSKKEKTTPKKITKPETPHILFEKLENSGNEVLTKIVEDEPEWLKYYPFRNDTNQRLSFQDYTGTALTSPHGDWFPLTRIVVNLTQDNPSVNGIYFESSAALSFMRILNNDTHTYMKSIIRNISFDSYTRNVSGYTIFAYGFCDNPKIKEHTWKLHLIASITQELLQCCEGVNPATGIFVPTPPQVQKVKYVYGHYIPNRRNSVLRCILTVGCSQLLTIRVSTNNPFAEITVKIRRELEENGDSELICEKTFTEKYTLPNWQFLVRSEEGEATPTVFLIEAELVNANSWPLTVIEQNLVTAIKEKVQRELLVFARTDSEKKSLGNFRRSSSGSMKDLPRSQEIIPDAAYWCVQVIVDSELESQVQLELNTRKAQEIRRLKEAWERAEPGRHLRAMAERQKMLELREEENKLLDGVGGKSRLFPLLLGNWSLGSSETRDDCLVVPENYGDQQQEKRAQEREEFDLKHSQREEEAARLCTEQKKTNDLLNNYMLKNEMESQALLEDGYKMRDACVVKPAGKTEGKGKKDKKEGKKKGKK